MTVAITGGTGFIGGHLTESLTVRGRAIRLLHRRDVAERPNVELVRGSMNDQDALERLVKGAAVVVHAAGAVQARSAADLDAINVEATYRLALLAEAAGVRRFILVSSLAATAPETSAYARSKRGGEEAAAAGLRNCRLEIVRPPAVYGPGDRMTLPIFKQLAAGLLIVPKEGTQRFSLIHVRDLAELLATLVAKPQSSPVVEPDDGMPHGYGWEDIAAIGATILGREIRIRPVPRWLMTLAGTACDLFGMLSDRPRPISRDKVGELYHQRWVARGDRPSGWEPRVTFAEGARETMTWYREQGWIQ